MIYQGLRVTLSPCQLLAEPQHCSLPLTQSHVDLPFLPLEGVSPAADEAGPHEHAVNVSSAGAEMFSAGKSHFPAPQRLYKHGLSYGLIWSVSPDTIMSSSPFPPRNK